MNFFHLIPVSMLVLSLSSVPAFENNHTAVVSKFENLKSINEDDESIPWSITRKLGWEDFLCEPKRNTDAVASTSTSLGLAYQTTNGILTYSITCNFSKNKSWGLLKTEYILAHEQGHFDITEIFARKLYKALQDYPVNKKTFKQDINDIYHAIVKEKEDMQAAYDGETDHSRSRKIQYEWLKKIEILLNETEPYAYYP